MSASGCYVSVCACVHVLKARDAGGFRCRLAFFQTVLPWSFELVLLCFFLALFQAPPAPFLALFQASLDLGCRPSFRPPLLQASLGPWLPLALCLHRFSSSTSSSSSSSSSSSCHSGLFEELEVALFQASNFLFCRDCFFWKSVSAL